MSWAMQGTATPQLKRELSVIRTLPHCAIFFGLGVSLPVNSTLMFFFKSNSQNFFHQTWELSRQGC